MKKILLSLILAVVALVSVHADEKKFSGVLAIDGDNNITYYLFEEKPLVTYLTQDNKTYAGLYVTGATEPVVKVEMTEGLELTVLYEAFIKTTLNSVGFGTFSSSYPVSFDNVSVYALKRDDTAGTVRLALNELTGSNTIPAANGVLLYGEPGQQVVLPYSAETPLTITDNDLKPSTLADGSLAAKVDNSYTLSNTSNQFKKYNGSAYVHNRAFYVVENPSLAKTLQTIDFFFGNGASTGINNTTSQVFTLDGKFIDNDKIVIVKNGVKYNVAGHIIK